ncbi:MAG: subtilase, partial [Blautia faecis]
QNSSMKKAKALTVKGSATRATLKKLVSKKKYYVRIRTYKIVSGKKYYSKWSSKKSVKIK